MAIKQDLEPWQEETYRQVLLSRPKSAILAPSSQEIGFSSQEPRGLFPFFLTTRLPFQTIKTNNNPSYDYATGVLPSSIVEQTEQTLKNIDAALKEAGATLKDVVRVRYILPDKKEFPLIWPVLKRVFGDVRPAATMIQAELMKDEMRLEIEVTAKKEHSDGLGAPL